MVLLLEANNDNGRVATAFTKAMALRNLSSRSLTLTASHLHSPIPILRPSRACRSPFTTSPSTCGSIRMGFSFSRHHSAPQAQAQTQFGGDGFRPDSNEEYSSLEGIEVLPWTDFTKSTTNSVYWFIAGAQCANAFSFGHRYLFASLHSPYITNSCCCEHAWTLYQDGVMHATYTRIFQCQWVCCYENILADWGTLAEPECFTMLIFLNLAAFPWSSFLLALQEHNCLCAAGLADVNPKEGEGHRFVEGQWTLRPGVRPINGVTLLSGTCKATSQWCLVQVPGLPSQAVSHFYWASWARPQIPWPDWSARRTHSGRPRESDVRCTWLQEWCLLSFLQHRGKTSPLEAWVQEGTYRI